MRSLTRDQFLRIFGLTSGAFDAQQRAGHVALAFGTPIPATPGRYFDLDLVAMAIAAGLARSLGRQTATTIVLGFFDQWVAAVGHADADTARNYFFAMGTIGWNKNERRPDEIWVTNGTTEQIISDLHNASSVVAVNITDIIKRLRDKAREAGIDLSQPFFFPRSTRDSPTSLPSSNRSARRENRAPPTKQKEITAPSSTDEPSGHQGSCEVERCSNSLRNINARN